MTREPTVYSIPAGASFVDALAATLLVEHAEDPLALSQLRILLPTRRAARTLREAFLRASSGRPLLLPRMQPIGDVEEDEILLGGFVGETATDLAVPAAIPALERTLLLTQLVLQWHQAAGRQEEPAQAFQLAAELARFLDQMQTEGKAFANLIDLVPEEFAHHWQITLEFLKIVGEAWPNILAERGYLDPATRRDRLLRTLADRWTSAPPDFPVIAAGSTGSIPATAELIKAIAYLPNGRVILPGLDSLLHPESWEALEPTHPQFGMKQLLAHMAVERSEVLPWPATPTNPARNMLLSEALRPAATTDQWQDLKVDKTAALDGLMRIDAPTQQDEAGAIALILRQTLEAPGQTASLITPDRRLARQVAAAMKRWDISLDDSAGTPLRQTSVAAFLMLVAGLIQDDFAPIPLLSALKHPLASGGQTTPAFRQHVRALERAILRGPRPAPGPEGITHTLEDAKESDLSAWWSALLVRMQPSLLLFGEPRAPFCDLIDAHLQLAEALAATDDETGAERLWHGDDGEAAAAFLSEFKQSAQHFPATDPRHFSALLETAMTGIVVRPSYGQHPRLSILGPLEARLHHADVVILGGLNEGTWPPDAGNDPWMSRPMKATFGLPLPERRVGLSAHDFVQATAAPRVYLTRAEKVDGAPTIPSRWLLRLDALVEDERWLQTPHLIWQQGLDSVETSTPCPPPEPRPPVAARPRTLSVTRIEAWMRDPYALYAEKILGLRPLEPIDADPGAADRGTFIHHALHLFFKRHPDGLPTDPVAALIDCGRDAFGGMMDRPQVRAFWWPRFEQIAAWYVEQQADRRGTARIVAAEQRGRLVLEALPGGPFVVTAQADRIDRLADGSFEIIDYKTGSAPTNLQLAAGYGAQMPLEAAILESGGFEGVPPGTVTELAWWLLKGDGSKNKIDALTGRSKLDLTLPELVAEARDGLARVVAAFDDKNTPYVSLPNPTERGYGDYDHLARVKEWGL
ncbi:MAG: double-strand break repair protein AddB [Alphaproteobacteria bacterium]